MGQEFERYGLLAAYLSEPIAMENPWSLGVGRIHIIS